MTGPALTPDRAQSDRDAELRRLGFDPARVVDERDVQILLGWTPDEQPAVVRALLGYRRPDALTVGASAPELMLRSLDGDQELSLARFRGRPVVLFFGSYSCPPFRRRAAELQQVADAYSDRARFRIIYLAEAHAADGWVGRANREENVLVAQHTTLAERRAAAMRFAHDLRLTIPILLDGLDDAAGRAFSAWPERIYILDGGGRIAYLGGRGPYDVRPQEAREALERQLATPPR